MATFQDEPANSTVQQNWRRIKTLVSVGKTVEVYRKKVGERQKLFLRVWTSKRADGSNKVNADANREY